MWPFSRKHRSRKTFRVSLPIVGANAVLRARYDAAQTTDENRRHWANADALSAAAANSLDVLIRSPLLGVKHLAQRPLVGGLAGIGGIAEGNESDQPVASRGAKLPGDRLGVRLLVARHPARAQLQ